MDLFSSIDYLGLIAGALTTVAFLPQLVKTYQSKSADDVSFLMFFLFGIGVILWGVYGWEIHAIPVVISNSITLILASSILVMKVIFSNKSDQ